MDNVLVLGANGKVGRRIVKNLTAKGKKVKTLLRNESQTDYMRELGALPVIGDLEKDYSNALEGVEVVIFTAGSGSSTGRDKTIDVDQEAAKRSMDLAREADVKLYIMVSAQGARSPEVDSPIRHYYKAKHNADEYLSKSGLTYLIFRPGRLLDDEGEGIVSVSLSEIEKGSTHRDDLALAISESIDLQELRNMTIEIVQGNKGVREALIELTR